MEDADLVNAGSMRLNNYFDYSDGTSPEPEFAREEDVCRICRGGSEENRPLLHPCRCSGSIKWVHEDCLLQWITHSRNKTCELCGHEFSFTKIYAHDAPRSLAFHEVLFGAVRHTSVSIQKVLRVVLVLCVWLLLIPLITSWIIHIYFSKDLDDLTSFFSKRLNLVDFSRDCIVGSIVSGSILCIFLSAAAFREFIVHNLDLINFQFGEADVNDRHEQDDDVDGEEEADEDEEAEEEHGGLAQLDQLDFVEHEAGHDFMDGLAVPANNQQPQQLLDDNNNNGDGRRNNNADVNNIFNPNVNDEVEFEELIGLKGPLSNLFENFVMVVLTHAAVLAIFLFFPFSLGRIYTRFVSTKFFTPQLSVLSKLNDTVASAVADSLSSEAAQPSSQNTFVGDIKLVGVGYLLLAFVGLFWMLLSFIIHTKYKVPYDPYTRQAMRVLSFVYTFFKVVIMIAVNFIVGPLFCGALVDSTTVEFFNTTVDARLAYAREEPMLAFLIHWMLGVVYLVQLSFSVRIVRGLVRPQVLWFLNNPDDPNFHYLREIIQTPLLTQLRRILLTFAMFTIMILSMVRTPLKLSKKLLPSLFPLTVTFSVQASLDLMFFWVITHIGFNNLNPRRLLKAFYGRWLRGVGRVLDLTDYLFGQQQWNNNNNEAEEAEEQRQQNVDDRPVYYPPLFPFRIATLIMLAWSTLITALAAVVCIPLIIGRRIVSLVAVTTPNDAYTYALGLYVIGACVYGTRYAVRQAQQQQFIEFLRRMYKYIVLGIKLLVLSSLWFGVLAILVGLAFELTFIVPLTIRVDQCYKISYSELWGLGLFNLGTWFRLVLIAPGQFFEPWKQRFEQIKQDGFANINAGRIMKDVIIPLFLRLGGFVYGPIVLCNYALPLLINLNPYYSSFMLRASYPFMLSLYIAYQISILVAKWFNDLHNTILDERYLVGRRLNNFVERSRSNSSVSQMPSPPLSPKSPPQSSPSAAVPPRPAIDLAAAAAATTTTAPSTSTTPLQQQQQQHPFIEIEHQQQQPYGVRTAAATASTASSSASSSRTFIYNNNHNHNHNYGVPNTVATAMPTHRRPFHAAAAFDDE